MYCTLLHWLRSSSILRERSPSGVVSLVTTMGLVVVPWVVGVEDGAWRC